MKVSTVIVLFCLFLSPVAAEPRAVEQLLSGRVDYVATTPTTMNAELVPLGKDRASVESQFSIDGFSPDPYSYLVVAKGSSQTRIDSLRQAFESMRKDGTWDTIFRKYQ